MYNEIEKRGVAEAVSLAYDSKYGLITEDAIILKHLIAGRIKKPDFKYIKIFRKDNSLVMDITNGEAVVMQKSNDSEALLENDVTRVALESKSGEKFYEFSAPIITEKMVTAEKKKISENILFFTGSKIEYEPTKRGSIKIGISLKSVDKKIIETISISVLIIFVVIAVSLTISYHFVSVILRPIKKVTQVAMEIAKGDLTKYVDVKPNDEIGIMADNFNTMTLSLKKTIGELEELKLDLEHKVETRTTDLKSAMSEKDRLLHELESVNSELKSFAYIISHDLKAPLRAISTLSTWILDDYSSKFDDQGREQLNLLIGRAKRMHNLIDGVLKYSRAVQSKKNMVEVDLNRLVLDVMELLSIPKNIDINIENRLPSILCEKVRIEQVFQNVLSNAIKYIDKPKGEIIIDYVENGEYWRFSVSDNGPGIEEKHFERIFKMFQTLTPRDEYENTGIGLSVTKKIVELYGGKIWVESKFGLGSTFFFTLPVNAALESKSA